MKKFFVSYGNSRFQNSVKRIEKEAHALNVFDEINVYRTEDLDEDFKRQHAWILKFPRIGGYGIWKPYIIQQTLNKMNNGDVLVYADAGCTLRPQGLARLQEYFIMTKANSGVSAFQTRDFLPFKRKYPRYMEKEWNKQDIISLLNAEEFLDTVQLASGAIIICKNEFSCKLVDEWYRISCLDNYHYIDDSPSREPNHVDFIEHRHDQSVFSLLVKKMGGDIIRDEILLYHHSKIDADVCPIWATRIRC